MLPGTVAAGSDGALGGGTVTIGAATLRSISTISTDNAFAPANSASTMDTGEYAMTVSGNVSGDGTLHKIGSGTLTLTGDNTFTGGIDIVAGFVAAVDEQAIGTGPVTIGAGGFMAAGSFSTDHAFTLTDSGSMVDTNGYALTISSNVGGAGTLNKTGTGTLTLSGDNTFAGGLDIAAGTVVAMDEGAIGAGGVNIGAGSFAAGSDFDTDKTFTLMHGSSTIDTDSHDLTLDGEITGSGTLNKTGAGTLTLTGDNAFSGGLDVSDGTVVAMDDDAMGAGDVTIGSGVFTPGSDFATGNDFSVTHGDSTIDTDGYDLTLSGDVDGNGALNKSGLGILTLLGDNAFSGGLDIDAGTVVAHDDGAVGGSTVTIGSANFAPGSTFSTDNAFAVTHGNSTIDTDGYDLTLVGNVSGVGTLNKTGAGTLALVGG